MAREGMAKTSVDIARENVLVEAAAKLFPVLELECEGNRAVLLGGHQDDIDSINVHAEGKVILLSEWVLERCLGLSEGTQLSPAEERRLTLTKACVVSYANQHLPRTPLLEWCQATCAQSGVARLAKGSRLLVFWWDMLHDQQVEKAHMRGQTWWPTAYMPRYPQYGVWFSAQVVRYDAKRATLHIVYDYNAPNEKELGKVILPLNYVHFGDTPPQANGLAQVLPPPWNPPPVVGPRGPTRVTSCREPPPLPTPQGVQVAVGEQVVVSGPDGRMQAGAGTGAGAGGEKGDSQDGLTTEGKWQHQLRLKQQLEQQDADANGRPEGQQPWQGKEQQLKQEQPVEQQQKQKVLVREGADAADRGAKEKGQMAKLSVHWQKGPGHKQGSPSPQGQQQQGQHQGQQQEQRQLPSAGVLQAKVVIWKDVKPDEAATGLEPVRPTKMQKSAVSSLSLPPPPPQCKIASATRIKRKAEQQQPLPEQLQGQPQAEQGSEGGLAAEEPPRAKRAKVAAGGGGPSHSPAVLDGVTATRLSAVAAADTAPVVEGKVAKGRMVTKQGMPHSCGGVGETTTATAAACEHFDGPLAQGNGGAAADHEALLERSWSWTVIRGGNTAAVATSPGLDSLEEDQWSGYGGGDLGAFEDGIGVDLGTSLETPDLDVSMQLEKPRWHAAQQQQLSFLGSESPAEGDTSAPQSEGQQKRPGMGGMPGLPPKPPRPPLQQQHSIPVAKDAVPPLQGSSCGAAGLLGLAAFATTSAVKEATAAGSGNKPADAPQPTLRGSCSPLPTPTAKLPAKSPATVVAGASAAPYVVGVARKPASSLSSAAASGGVPPSFGGVGEAALCAAAAPDAVGRVLEAAGLEAGEMERPGGGPGTRAERTKVRAFTSHGHSASAAPANSVQPPLQQLGTDSQPQPQAQPHSQSQPPGCQLPTLQPASDDEPQVAHLRSSKSPALPKAGAMPGEDKGASRDAKGGKWRSSDGAGPSQGGPAPPARTVAAQKSTGVKRQHSDGGGLGDRGAIREGSAGTPAALEVVEGAAGASDDPVLGTEVLSPSPWPVVNLALGPTSRVRWPGLNLMMPSQISELVRMQAVIPLARPSCDAHVAALEGRVEAVGAGLDRGAPLHLHLPPPMGDSDDDDHTWHFLQQGRQGPARPPAGPTLGTSLVSLCDSMRDLADVVDAVAPLGQNSPALPQAAAALPAAKAMDATVPAAPPPPPPEGAAVAAEGGALGCSTEELQQSVAAARAPGAIIPTATAPGQQQQLEQQQMQSLLGGSSGSGLLEDDEDDKDDAFSFVDHGKYRIVQPPPERLAAYEGIMKERTPSKAAAVMATTARGAVMTVQQVV